jgi:hypothetical protein
MEVVAEDALVSRHRGFRFRPFAVDAGRMPIDKIDAVGYRRSTDEDTNHRTALALEKKLGAEPGSLATTAYSDHSAGHGVVLYA